MNAATGGVWVSSLAPESVGARCVVCLKTVTPSADNVAIIEEDESEVSSHPPPDTNIPGPSGGFWRGEVGETRGVATGETT